MKKTLALFILFFFYVAIQAQYFSAPGAIVVASSDISLPNVNAIFLFNGTNAATITYTNADFKEWQKMDGTFYSNTAQMSPDEGGYLLITNTGEYQIWVVDYSQYILSINELKIYYEEADKCENLIIEPIFSDLTKKIFYQNKEGQTAELSREFTITYNEIKWENSAWSEPTKNTIKQTYPFVSLSITAPLCTTIFTIYGDQYASQFGLDVSCNSSVFQPIRVEAHPSGSVAQRDSKTEIDPASVSKTISISRNCKCKKELATTTNGAGRIGGSAPLVVDFTGNANVDAANFYEWYIYPTGNAASALRYTDSNLRYTFSESGEYTVKLVVSSDGCSYSDSIYVTVLESFMDVPNVFTPNGDGVNDEFRIVYRSLSSFSGWIYNRWGRLVYKWNDPSKGWDGRINGKMANPGAYFYILQGIGTDKDKNGNFLEWKCSGDINLLRGKN